MFVTLSAYDNSLKVCSRIVLQWDAPYGIRMDAAFEADMASFFPQARVCADVSEQ